MYSKLDAQKLSVLGGEVADIGVGGLTLGGEYIYCRGKQSLISLGWHILLLWAIRVGM